ncbi:AAA family ATPAse [Lasiodiplodia theobromae]|uniref:AAA family ATPAse n=1 Tax=Lasiodiplodia theobromae TaxID=45133 RepID=UPI0015C34B56|nr:AAA family ATPAse [Lasiodiplodia theobromae]KAF4542890.1 AAA family ATPAse [Lasiodiplodia theobromae]
MAWDSLLNMDKDLKQIYHSEKQARSNIPISGDLSEHPGSSEPKYSPRKQRFPSYHGPPMQGDFREQQKLLENQRFLDNQDILNAEIFFYHFQFFEEEYREVDELLSKSLISGIYVKYLSAPGTILTTRVNGNDIGYLQRTFFSDESRTAWGAKVTNWAFDGTFKMDEMKIKIDVKDFKHMPRDITSLEFYPIRYAERVRQRLMTRGHQFWRCRKSAYVAYTGLDMNQETSYDNTRFLVDVRTYHTMHGKDDSMLMYCSESAQLPDAFMDRDLPPDDGTFIYLVPASIYGFDIQEKKWVNLQVDNIHQLKWNTEAFDALAIDEDSKELINALVNNKIAAEKATDMVRGKGNGLIILLHGGPGTGKTLTAESVAEIAKKPLYRVTCGDIGTEPREVEKYLQKIFYLGKIWDCVVLLDEADVFLEQRTLSDLSRNALVSVFLCTLEYYDGILILTSNRVGTFDEAFKSRIQLALHYPNLDLAQRKQIWKNFTHRLDSLEEDVDTDAILVSINKLAKYEMNGRQIRNAITTARQLALFKEETLTTKHLEHSIRVSGKFDQYLEEVHDQIKDDEMARQSGFR